MSSVRAPLVRCGDLIHACGGLLPRHDGACGALRTPSPSAREGQPALSPPHSIRHVSSDVSGKKSMEWMRTSDEFKANPIGHFVDPELVAADLANGTTFAEIHADAMAGGLRAPAGPRRDPGDVLMKLCRFDAGAGPRHGLVENGYVVDREDPVERHALEEIRLLAPVLPRKFLAIGLNSPITSPSRAWRRPSPRCSSTSRSRA